MKQRLLLGLLVAASTSSLANAHFVLIMPAASKVQNRLGDPQKIAPCGGVSANPGRGTPANPGVPSGAITSVKGGTDLDLMVQETIFHPGHYRVALARTEAQLPPDPDVKVVETEKGPRSRGCRSRWGISSAASPISTALPLDCRPKSARKQVSSPASRSR